MKIPAINRLIKTAKKSNLMRARHATLILSGGAPVAIGYNHDGMHSEVTALNKLWPNKRKGVTIINIRLTSAGSIGTSKPCDDCLEYLIDNEVGKIFYTDQEGRWIRV